MPELRESQMLSNVQRCLVADTVMRAAVIVRERDLSSAPVAGEVSHVVGIVTDRRSAPRGLARSLADSTPLTEIMTSHKLVGVLPSDTVQTAGQRMAEARVCHELVVDTHSKLLGAIEPSGHGASKPPKEQWLAPGTASRKAARPEPGWGETAGPQT